MIQHLPAVVASEGLLVVGAAVLLSLLLVQERVAAASSSVATADASVRTLAAACAGVEAVLS